MTPRSLTRVAAQAALQIGRGVPSEQLEAKASLCLQDFAASCLAALRGSLRRPVLQVCARYAGSPQARVWGWQGSVGAETAALCNAMLGHSLIREDMHLSGGSHPGVVIVPAMLALAERHRWSGQTLVRGIVAGYQLMGALGAAARTGRRNEHFRPLGIYGAFGVAGGAAAALDLDEAVATAALGLAANCGAGLNQWPWDGGQEVFLHPGLAARNGILALDLACSGMDASETILEGADGLFAAYGFGRNAVDVFLRRLESPGLILEVTHKPHAGCNFIQTAIAAALGARAQNRGAFVASDVESVSIFTFEAARRYPGCDNAGPFTSAQQTKMSLQYGVASALLFGAPDEASYRRWDEAALHEVMARTRIVIDPEFERIYPRAQPARVTVRLRGGTALACELPDVPWLAAPAVRQRFADEAARLLSAEELRDLVARLDNLCAVEDASALLAKLHARAAGS